MRTLLATVERYPDIKSAGNVLALQAEIERLESMIADRRELYNDQVFRYNTRIGQVPGVLLAGAFGWSARAFFDAEPAADRAPRGSRRRRNGAMTGPAPEPALTRLVLARHGETAWSKAGRHTGRTDVPLTPTGRVQARRLGSALAGRSFSRVVSSPLARATATARLAGFADRMELDPELQEWDYGVYEGRRRIDIERDDPGWTIWTRPIPDGESLAALGARADRVIARLLPFGGDVLVFAHGHVLRVLAARWIGGAATPRQPPRAGDRDRVGAGLGGGPPGDRALELGGPPCRPAATGEPRRRGAGGAGRRFAVEFILRASVPSR